MPLLAAVVIMTFAIRGAIDAIRSQTGIEMRRAGRAAASHPRTRDAVRRYRAWLDEGHAAGWRTRGWWAWHSDRAARYAYTGGRWVYRAARNRNGEPGPLRRIWEAGKAGARHARQQRQTGERYDPVAACPHCGAVTRARVVTEGRCPYCVSPGPATPAAGPAPTYWCPGCHDEVSLRAGTLCTGCRRRGVPAPETTRPAAPPASALPGPVDTIACRDCGAAAGQPCAPDCHYDPERPCPGCGVTGADPHGPGADGKPCRFDPTIAANYTNPADAPSFARRDPPAAEPIPETARPCTICHAPAGEECAPDCPTRASSERPSDVDADSGLPPVAFARACPCCGEPGEAGRLCRGCSDANCMPTNNADGILGYHGDCQRPLADVPAGTEDDEQPDEAELAEHDARAAADRGDRERVGAGHPLYTETPPGTGPGGEGGTSTMAGTRTTVDTSMDTEAGQSLDGTRGAMGGAAGIAQTMIDQLEAMGADLEGAGADTDVRAGVAELMELAEEMKGKAEGIDGLLEQRAEPVREAVHQAGGEEHVADETAWHTKGE